MSTDPVTRFLDAVALGTGVPSDIYAAEAVLDATVPSWRLEKHGPDEIAAQTSGWFDSPGQLYELERGELPTGEVVSFTLAWDAPQPESARQIHVFTVEDGLITGQQMWCGGRWGASLMALIEDELQRARAHA